MKLKVYLGILLTVITLSSVLAQPGGGCVCDECDYSDSSVQCTVTGQFGLTVYSNAEACAYTEPSCGGIPVDTNSWTLIIAGISILIVGAVLTSKFNSK